jgi:hypothetical protein
MEENQMFDFQFDNLICSEWSLKLIKENAEMLPAPEGFGVLGSISGVAIQVSRWLPEKQILFRQGEKLVAILTIADESFIVRKVDIDMGIGIKPIPFNFGERTQK